MIDVAAEFVLLNIGDGNPLGSQVRTRHLLSETTADCYIALDADGQRHFLVRASGDRVNHDSASQGVSLAGRTLLVDGVQILFADLHCRMASLDLVFERLVEDILNRLVAQPRQTPELVCRATLADWRTLLKSAGAPLPREVVVGIAGELEVLSRLRGDPVAVVEAWTGPSSTIHDFSSGAGELEVKATASVDGNFIKISNLDQLDPGGLRALHLAVVHLREDRAGPSLDDRIRHLLDAGAPRDLLLERVASAGYVFESGADDGARFSVRQIRVWEVGEKFPGLRRDEIAHRLRGISQVRYELALDSAPRPLTDPGTFFDNWLEESC